ncbi:hypothetical protein [Aquirhabdus sp.]|uniref:hypothetical protein n=1 Tax=Aquirhabdus sp. TaxID=2824160 RepID=UPI00396D01AF
MESVVNLLSETEISQEILKNNAHNIKVSIDLDNKDVYLEYSSRQALYELGKTLMVEAIQGCGQLELYPLGSEGSWLIVEGVRLTEDSSRIFVFSPSQSPAEKL